jgi:hypothetical protein
MAQQTQTLYYCDNCHKKLTTCDNTLCISTEKDSFGHSWSRLKVKIQNHHGYHNDGKVDDAELCQKCAIDILADALKKVKAGIRATIGTESIYEEKWHNSKSAL